jgi:hypothetical protein
MYPPDWQLLDDSSDRMILATPSNVNTGILTVSVALDASEEDEGSEDYLVGGVEFAIGDGLLREANFDDVFWLDTNFDGIAGDQDIYGLELELAIDPQTGEPIPQDSSAPVWWYGYYDPVPRPAPGYVFQTIGSAAVLFEFADIVVLSFEPSAGYPSN